MNPVLIAKLVGGAVASALVLFIAGWLISQVASNRSRGKQLEQITAATALLVQNPKLRTVDVAGQIYVFDVTVKELRRAAASCSSKVDALGAETRRLQEAAAEARKQALGRVSAAEAVRQRFVSESRSAAGQASPACLSPALKDQWQ